MQLRSLEGWTLIIVGAVWLSFAGDGGAVRALFAGTVGAVLGGMGVASLLIPGDRRIPAHAAFAAVVGALIAILGVFSFGLSAALGLVAASLIAAVAAGRFALAAAPSTPGVPVAEDSLALAAKVALDEAVLGSFHLRLSFPVGRELERVVAESHELLEHHAERGYLDKPIAYHRDPLPLETPRIQNSRLFGVEYEHLSFDSEWEPEPDEPGRERWLRGTANRTAHAYVVRGDPERPWLVAIDGYRTGMAVADLGVFDPRFYHQRLGLNLLIPVLPLHGPRRVGRLSGDGYLDADPVVFTYAEAQAMWDIRRLVGWARAQGASQVGVMGISLGGYNAALLASIEDGLSCAIAGIPVADFAPLLSHHAPSCCVRCRPWFSSRRCRTRGARCSAGSRTASCPPSTSAI